MNELNDQQEEQVSKGLMSKELSWPQFDQQGPDKYRSIYEISNLRGVDLVINSSHTGMLENLCSITCQLAARLIMYSSAVEIQQHSREDSPLYLECGGFHLFFFFIFVSGVSLSHVLLAIKNIIAPPSCHLLSLSRIRIYCSGSDVVVTLFYADIATCLRILWKW